MYAFQYSIEIRRSSLHTDLCQKFVMGNPPRLQRKQAEGADQLNLHTDLGLQEKFSNVLLNISGR